jgi:hypothetical protein
MVKVPGMPELEFLGIQDALDPESIPNPPKKTVNRDTFFQTKVQVAQNKTFTVREIIKHQANIEGGVHAGKPKNANEEKLSEIEDTITILSLPPGLRQLQAIGRVILKTLQPLRVVLHSNKATEINPDDVSAHP